MSQREIRHRVPNFEFDQDTPKHWLGGSAFKTHFLNSLTIVFPTGEKYFIRSISKVQKNIKSQLLKENAKNFIKQEAQHSKEHEKFFSILGLQGYDHQAIIKILDHIVTKVFEPFFSKEMNLSITAGLEHITAMLSEISLEENFLETAPEQLRDLFNWHAAEEIEHRAVAFDVLQAITKSYSKRIQGLIFGYLFISLFSSCCTIYFLHKDKVLFKPSTYNDFKKIFFTEEKLFFKAVKIFYRYLSPRFHPDQEELENLSNPIFQSIFNIKNQKAI